MPALEFMYGTNGSPDYLIIAKNLDAGLGVKPVLAVIGGPPVGVVGVYIGLRIRASKWGAKKVTPLSAAPSDGSPKVKSWEDAFPDLEFSKADFGRASAMMGSIIHRAPWQTDDIKKIIADSKLLEKFGAWLAERVPEDQMILPPEEFVAWVGGEISAGLADMSSKLSMNMDVSDPGVGYLEDVISSLKLPSYMGDKAASDASTVSGNDLGGLTNILAVPKGAHLSLVTNNDEAEIPGGGKEPSIH